MSSCKQRMEHFPDAVAASTKSFGARCKKRIRPDGRRMESRKTFFERCVSTACLRYSRQGRTIGCVRTQKLSQPLAERRSRTMLSASLLPLNRRQVHHKAATAADDNNNNNTESEANTNNKICCGNNGFTAHRGGYIKRYECPGSPRRLSPPPALPATWEGAEVSSSESLRRGAREVDDWIGSGQPDPMLEGSESTGSLYDYVGGSQRPPLRAAQLRLLTRLATAVEFAVEAATAKSPRPTKLTERTRDGAADKSLPD